MKKLILPIISLISISICCILLIAVVVLAVNSNHKNRNIKELEAEKETLNQQIIEQAEVEAQFKEIFGTDPDSFVSGAKENENNVYVFFQVGTDAETIYKLWDVIQAQGDYEISFTSEEEAKIEWFNAKKDENLALAEAAKNTDLPASFEIKTNGKEEAAELKTYLESIQGEYSIYDVRLSGI